jgi:hypothetical protein
MAPSAGRAARLLLGAGDAFLTQPLDRLVGVTVGSRKGLLAIHHSRAGLVAQVFDKLGGYGCHRS